MKNYKNLFLVLVVLLCSSCKMSAKESKNESSNAQDATEVVVLNKSDFLSKVYDFEKNPNKWVYEGDKPCIIDFYADWCGPCKKVAPILKELAAQYKGKIVIYKINVDNERDLASYFKVQSIPMMLFVPLKEKPKMTMGALPKEEIEKQINSFLLSPQ